jgi:hypothetical protein
MNYQELITQFDETIDAVELDPRPNFKAAARRICDRHLLGLPPEIAEIIAASRLRTLGAQAAEALHSGRYDRLDSCLTAFAESLATTVGWERREGVLKPLTAATECAKWAPRLSECLWNSFERHALVEILTPDDLPIVAVSLREIETSNRVLKRDFFMELRDCHTSESFFRSQGTPEHVIAAAEERAHAEAIALARPFSDFAGPGKRPAGVA